MQAIIQTDSKTVELQERERPMISENECLVRVYTAGICGSDTYAYQYNDGYEWVPIPRIMGREDSGTAVETGPNVELFAEGDRVIEEPIHDCRECFQCRNGQPNVCQDFSITGMHRDGATLNT